jgi:hypothetical protein
MLGKKLIDTQLSKKAIRLMLFSTMTLVWLRGL